VLDVNYYQDYDLSAVYMRNWDTRDESGSDSGCEWKQDWEDVQRVCKLLRLPCEMVTWLDSFVPTYLIIPGGPFARILDSRIRAFAQGLGVRLHPQSRC
jgi:hypothetical protein